MAGPAYQWGHWRFEPTESRLLRDGAIVPLPARTLDLLATLLNRAPRLITKEEILSAVWADAVVEEGNIAFHVAALRKVLDEDDGPSSIETVRGRGYRFVKQLAIHHLPPTEDLRREAVERAMAETIAVQPPAPAEAPVPMPAPAPSTTAQRRADAPWVISALLAMVVIALAVVLWRQSRPEEITIAIQQFEIVNPPAGEENFPDGLRTYLKTKLELAGVKTAEPGEATSLLSGQLHPKDGGFTVTIQLTRSAGNARIWDWSFEVPADADKPTSGQDDARSRLQAVIAMRAAEGLARYLSLSEGVPVTR
jgi:DNA-binding winged helix-turn-helix (wHTH) protein